MWVFWRGEEGWKVSGETFVRKGSWAKGDGGKMRRDEKFKKKNPRLLKANKEEKNFMSYMQNFNILCLRPVIINV